LRKRPASGFRWGWSRYWGRWSHWWRGEQILI